MILGTRVDGEASCVASSYISMAKMLSRQRNDMHIKYPIPSLPVALIAGGETVVTLPQNCIGKGGQNQELALSAAMKMQEIGLQDVVLACVGADGTDESTDAAGAIVYEGIVNKDTINNAKDALKNHDAYSFLELTKSLMISCKITGLLNSLTAMGIHGRPHFNKFRSTVISCQILIRSQSLIAR